MRWHAALRYCIAPWLLLPPPSHAEEVIASSDPTASGKAAIRAAMLESIQNDHGVDLKTAEEILLAESAATKHYSVIRDFLGKRYGGAWFDADLRKLVVGTTDLDDFEWIELVGAQPVLVNHSLDDLGGLADVIWSLQEDGVVHGVEAVCQDVEHNGLEVTLDANSVDLVLQASSELDDFPIRFVTTTQAPQLLGTIFGAE